MGIGYSKPFTKPMKCIVPLIELDKEYTHFILFPIKTQNVNSRENPFKFGFK